MLESAMTFLSPVAFLMVGKGQPIKPQAGKSHKNHSY